MTTSERLAALETEVKESRKKIDKLFDAVYGNGKPGLIADVQAIRQKLDDQKNHGQTWQWLAATVISASAVLVAWLK